ncbi:oligopeptide/dipeptide ABC transporter ATP-binding protein [Mesorhizobium sp. YM1C-6-2]|uniref:ABC transporter ATP-binding protein n=1 Tax=Mesorhizobium sp. YM1C-6-2 TaxID=1827501 RepID=UPI000EF285A0|nr:oligopeptide/dipeptide ABC transporter ATP-binding protein [Mesorhizobium sp. YM1C-6-2]RLP26951.1 ATP-binding cassette domain-containing protein [Mesorhizobium sp. YM1C-6-2]
MKGELAPASDAGNDRKPLLKATGLQKYFPTASKGISGLFGRSRPLRAVDDVTFEIMPGEVFGLVGESGSGKSTLGSMVAHLLSPTAGAVELDGKPWSTLSDRELGARRRDVQVVFQNPYGSLNPRWTVERIVGEPIITHERVARRALRERVAELLLAVGLSVEHLDRLPSQFSGGQRQRIALARALAGSPRLLVADEPVSALDVSVQAQVINLMRDLHERQRMAMLFISHNLAVVHHLCERVGILYLGKLVEVGPVDEVFSRPLHPYTQALLDAIPEAEPQPARLVPLKGEIPSPTAPPSGCHFHPRCTRAQAKCREVPPVITVKGSQRHVACHFPND